MNGYIIFTDLKGFSKLSEPEVKLFYQYVVPKLSVEIHKYKEKSKIWNTWGDAIVAIFEDGKDAVDMMLCYRDFFNRSDSDIDNKKIKPRIAGHFGEFEIFDDPILGSLNMIGSNINATARIEPITRAGEAFVTIHFKNAIEASPQVLNHVKFDELGQVSLAKNFGALELFRLYKSSEKPRIIDKILKQDLSLALPDSPVMAQDEVETITFFNTVPLKRFKRLLESENVEGKSGQFIYELAELCKKNAMYPEALEFIKIVENTFLEVDGIKVYPYRYKRELIKLKANCLTRIGDYENAADIVYGLWQSGLHDSDTLSMLAAQYKRRALYNEGKVVGKDEMNIELLVRAKNIYTEAFRLNIDDYYPAINTAYLYKLIGGKDTGKGTKLAFYISDSWGDAAGENWWIDSTLAECEILQEDFEAAIIKMNEAITQHNPSNFEKNTVFEQISIFASILGLEENVKPILQLLKVEE